MRSQEQTTHRMNQEFSSFDSQPNLSVRSQARSGGQGIPVAPETNHIIRTYTVGFSSIRGQGKGLKWIQVFFFYLPLRLGHQESRFMNLCIAGTIQPALSLQVNDSPSVQKVTFYKFHGIFNFSFRCKDLHKKGGVEGHVNRIKTKKRQMYGRVGFGLLQRKVILSKTG